MILPPEGRLLLRFLLRDRDLEDLMNVLCFRQAYWLLLRFSIAMHAAALIYDLAFLATYQRERLLIGRWV